MNFTLKAMVIFLLMVAAFFMFAPQERVEVVKAKWRSITGEPGQACFEYWAESLKDPTSAVIVRSVVLGDRVVTHYRAKNSYGAFVSGEFDCPLENGKIDEERILMDRIKLLLGK